MSACPSDYPLTQLRTPIAQSLSYCIFWPMPEIAPKEGRLAGRQVGLGLGNQIQLLFVLLFVGPFAVRGQDTNETLLPPASSIWKAGVAEGFNKGTHEFNASAGYGLGLDDFGSRHHHDWVLGVASYGWMISNVVGEDRFYRGNWELLAEFFGGAQFHPDTEYVVGIGPVLRYNFAVGHRLVPFIDAGAGLSATSIREGDLSTTFEFNLQGGLGLRWFVCNDLSLTLAAHYIHLSNAGIDNPNNGVNNITIMLGVSWFF